MTDALLLSPIKRRRFCRTRHPNAETGRVLDEGQRVSTHDLESPATIGSHPVDQP